MQLLLWNYNHDWTDNVNYYFIFVIFFRSIFIYIIILYSFNYYLFLQVCEITIVWFCFTLPSRPIFVSNDIPPKPLHPFHFPCQHVLALMAGTSLSLAAQSSRLSNEINVSPSCREAVIKPLKLAPPTECVVFFFLSLTGRKDRRKKEC